MSSPLDSITPLTLKTQFENLIDDTLDEDFTYRLMEQAKNWVEAMIKPQILQDIDASQSTSTSETYLTMKTLHQSVRTILKLVVNNIPYTPVAFRSRIAFRNSSRRYYVDWKNWQFALCGTQSGTFAINVYFLSRSPVISTATKDVAAQILWPDEFKPLIPYAMAAIQQNNISPDDTAMRQAPFQDAIANKILDNFIAWDQDLKLAEMDNRLGFQENFDGEYPIGEDGYFPNSGSFNNPFLGNM